MIIEFHSRTPLQYSNAPLRDSNQYFYYGNHDLVNVVSAGSSFIIIKWNAFESVVFTKGNFISVTMSVLQNVSPLHENAAEI